VISPRDLSATLAATALLGLTITAGHAMAEQSGTRSAADTIAQANHPLAHPSKATPSPKPAPAAPAGGSCNSPGGCSGPVKPG
jgi:hypothetical protein